MPSELTKTYVPSFDEFIEDPDKWLSQIGDNAQTPQSGNNAQPTVSEEGAQNAAAPGDVEMGNAQPTIPGSEAGASASPDNGWGDTGSAGAQPVGGQMAQDNAGAVGAQTPVEGAQPNAQGGFGAPAQPGAQGPSPEAGVQSGATPAPEAGTAPAQPSAQAPAQPAPAPGAQEEEQNKQNTPAPAATGF